LGSQPNIMARPIYAYLRNISSYVILQPKQINVTEEYLRENAYRYVLTYADTVYQFGAELAVIENPKYLEALLSPLISYLEYDEPVLVEKVKSWLLGKNPKAKTAIKTYGQGILPYAEHQGKPFFILNALRNVRLEINLIEPSDASTEYKVTFNYDTSVAADAFRLFLSAIPDNVKRFEQMLKDNLEVYLETMLKWVRMNFIYSFDGRLSTTEDKVLSTFICVHYLTGLQFFPKYQKAIHRSLDRLTAYLTGIPVNEVNEILKGNSVIEELRNKSFQTIAGLIDRHVELGIIPMRVSELSISVKLLRYTLYGLILFGSVAGYASMAIILYRNMPLIAARLFKDIKPFWQSVGKQYYDYIKA